MSMNFHNRRACRAIARSSEETTAASFSNELANSLLWTPLACWPRPSPAQLSCLASILGNRINPEAAPAVEPGPNQARQPIQIPLP